MIDEELYQYATDELNSDRRDTELWNRACALARDDHDEARFLYTNLRVEELLEQKANGEPMPEMPDSVKGAASVAFDLDAAPNATEGLGLMLDTDDENSGDEVISSSNRSFSESSASADISEDLIADLALSNEANASEDDAPLPNADALSMDSEDESEVTLDSLSFSEASEDTATSEFDATAESTLAVDDSSPAFDLDSPSADSLAAESALLDADLDIAALAAQASEQLRDKADIGAAGLTNDSVTAAEDDSEDNPDALSLEFEEALDTATPLEKTPFNSDALDAIATETGAFESIDTPSMESADISPAEPAFDALNDNVDGNEASTDSTSLNENELAFLDASIEKGRDEIADQHREVLHQKDALTEELERQADTFLSEGDETETDYIDHAELVHDTVEIDEISTTTASIDAVADTVDAAKMDDFNTDDFSSDEAIDNMAGSGAGNFDVDALAGTKENDFDVDALTGENDNTIDVSAGVTSAVAAGGAALAATAAIAKDQGSQISQDYSPPGMPEISADRPSLDQAELLSGRGRNYRVFSRGPEDNRAVKDGVSWTAMLFTLPWLLVKRMPLTAIVYALLWLALAAGLVITGLHWLDAPKNAQNTLAIWPLAFAALAVIGLIVLPFFMANRWHASSLSKRGYEEIALVRAKGPRGAIDRIMQMAS